MKDQKISTVLGATILVIIAATVVGFVFLCVKKYPITYDIAPVVISKQLQHDKLLTINDEFSKDGQKIYQNNNCLPEKYLNLLDPISFEVVNNCFIKDKNAVYYRPYCGQDCLYEKHEQADSLTLINLGNGFLKDKNFVYFSYSNSDNKIIINADPNSFEALTDGFSKDKLNIYYWDIKVEDIDHNTVKIIDDSLIDDKNSRFQCMSDIYGPRCEKIKIK